MTQESLKVFLETEVTWAKRSVKDAKVGAGLKQYYLGYIDAMEAILDNLERSNEVGSYDTKA